MNDYLLNMEWKEVNNALVREYEFENQTEAATFALKVAKRSDELNHHADIELYQWRKLRLTISTHSEGRITEKDHDWVREINQL